MTSASNGEEPVQFAGYIESKITSPCLCFTHAITRINAKLDSDGRLTLSAWLFNQLDCADFVWRTKNLLFDWVSIEKHLLCVNKYLNTIYANVTKA
jgi:hypothetical protein